MCNVSCKTVRYNRVVSSLFFIFFLFSRAIPVSAATDEIVKKILSSDTTGISVEVLFPEPMIEQQIEMGNLWTAVSLPDASYDRESGLPRLPYATFTVGIPPTGSVHVSASSARWKVLKVSPILPVPEIVLPDELSGEMTLPDPATLVTRYSADPKVYQASRMIWPPDIVTKAQEGTIRQQRVASIRVNPVRFDPSNGQLLVTDRIVIRVDFPDVTTVDLKSVPDHISFEQQFDSLLLNAEVARKFRTPRVSSESQKKSSTIGARPAKAPTQYKFILRQTGFYSMSNTQLLSSFGVNLSAYDPRTFRMFYKGSEIPISVTGQSDGVFNSTDKIEFYGLENADFYSWDSTYFLEVGGPTAGLRITTRTASPSSPSSPTTFARTDHGEENHLWGGNLQNMTMVEDAWHWNYVLTNTTVDFPFTLLNYNSGYSGNVTLRLYLRGITYKDGYEPDHKVGISINGSAAQILTWDGATIFQTPPLTFANSVLQEGLNQIHLNAMDPGGGALNNFYLNWFELDYYDTFVAEGEPFAFTLPAGGWNVSISNFAENSIRAFDITNPLSPVEILSTSVSGSAGNYTLTVLDEHLSSSVDYTAFTSSMTQLPDSVLLFQSTNLHDTVNAADYLIITHPDFLTQSQQLASHRTLQGFVTKVATTTSVYDEFNYGFVDPQAIRDFLTFAYANWSDPTLTYVVLMGDTTTDPKQFQGYATISYVPTTLFITPILNQTANDHWYTRLTGTDYFSDVHLGRLTPQTAGQAQDMVDKLIAYDNYPAPISGWNRNVIFVTDNADSAGCWECSSDALIAAWLPKHLQPERIYLKDYASGVACRTDIINHFNSDTTSAPLVNYFGHGSINIWAGEQILRTDDIPTLTNNSRLPFIIAMTCYNNYFAYGYQGYQCLGEDMVDAAGHGAIGFISSTGLTYLINDDTLNQKIFQALFSSIPYKPGPAFTAAKNSMAGDTECPDEVRNGAYIGDPAIELPLARPGVPAISLLSIIFLLVLISCILIFTK